MDTPDTSKMQSEFLGEAKGLFDSLLDFSFNTVVTLKIIKLLYIASIVVAGLGTLGWIGTAWRSHSIFLFPGTLILAPILFFFYVVSARVALEVVMAIFRIADSLKKIEEKTK